jgi:uncharacterized protein
VIVWDERKRLSNIAKHGLDFRDAYLIYDNPEKLTITIIRNNEMRQLDIAMVEVLGMILAFVYVVRGTDIRAISFRRASRRERRRYEETRTKQD